MSLAKDSVSGSDAVDTTSCALAQQGKVIKVPPGAAVGTDSEIPNRLQKFHVTSAGCWEWIGARFTNGYGSAQFNGRATPAHRAMWMALVGPIPEGVFVCHRCDNRPCCNPAHLFLGTQKDNMQDCARKGRIRGGQRKGGKRIVTKPNRTDTLRAKSKARGLTRESRRAAKRLAILAMYESGITQGEVALAFGITQGAVCRHIKRACGGARA